VGLNFGYVAIYVMCRLWTKNCTKLLGISFNMIYFVFMLYLLFSAKHKYILVLNFCYDHKMTRFTFSEFIMILGLLEEFILDLCLDLNIFV
jgi:hypothetical protein